MVKFIILIVITVNIFGKGLTKQCEDAIQFATKIHWNYVNGIADFKSSYNAKKKAEKICGFKI